MSITSYSMPLGLGLAEFQSTTTPEWSAGSNMIIER